ncbi:FtsX-like permease family protein, partial [Saccharopolyspora sp. NPDC047091]|uniref:FtsX-like permease family protein n=1 Tax=Saccharopolyspora sp. NPDC047091 TaxID=3155924 RepID=UPI0033D56613
LLLPVVVFVISTTRLAEAARQRRLAALRLVGASAWQVRRIASGETLVGTITGVLAGWALFITCHVVADRVDVADESMFTADLAPAWWAAVLITLGVPLTTVLISLAALRGAVHDPLRSVRQATPIRRRLWPRLVPLVLGLAGAVFPWPQVYSSNAVRLAIPAGSVALVLVSVPLLLSWIVETVARRWHGGPVAWQLALRRLHLTSGTAARSVSAIAVVVTGVIALQTMFASLEHQALRLAGRAGAAPAQISIGGEEDRTGRDGMSATAAEVAALPGVSSVSPHHSISLQSGRSVARVVIVDCATAAASFPVGECRDGDAFLPEHTAGTDEQLPISAGQQWEILTTGSNATGAGTIAWTIPPLRHIGPSTDSSNTAELVLTPAAAAGIPMEIRSVRIEVDPTAQAPPDLEEQVRTVAGAHLPFPAVHRSVALTDSSAELRMVEYGLLLGAMVVFALIGCSLLVTAVEQIQERTRPMAVLGAVGAKRSTLVWSAFLQNAVPMLLALLLAVPLGCLLGGLIMVSLFAAPPVPDLPGMGAVLSFAAVSVLVVTALTAPALSKAMSSDGLHTE